MVGLADAPPEQHGFDRTAVIIDVQPLAAVLCRGVERQQLVRQSPGREERDHLLGKLIRPIVVCAIGNGHREPIGL